MTQPVDPLITRYRPKEFQYVIGHEHHCRSLEGVLKRGDSHCFLFSGPKGTGKTTLAYIVAKKLGCNKITEIDAATYTGVEDMRNVKAGMEYKAFGKSPVKVVLVDECHMLSQNAWAALLKDTEKPPAHVYWIFCTTNLSKVNKAIVSRSTHYDLEPLSLDELEKVIDRICKRDNITLNAGVKSVILKEAEGSPRQAISNLAKCRDAKDRAEAAKLLQAELETDKSYQLCQLLASGKTGAVQWQKAMKFVEDVKSPESLRIMVVNYMASATKNQKTDRNCLFFLNILDAFGTSYAQSDGMAPLLISIGRVLFPDA